MQRIALRQLQTVELTLDPMEVVAHLAQAGAPGHTRTCAIGTDQIGTPPCPLHLPAIAIDFGLAEGLLQAQIDTTGTQLGGEPAHQVRGVSGEEVVARRLQLHTAQVGRIQAHARDALHQVLGNVAQPGLFHRLLHHDAGGVQALAGVCLAFKHADAKTVLRCGQCTGRTGKACADDDYIVVVGGGHVGHRSITVGERRCSVACARGGAMECR